MLINTPPSNAAEAAVIARSRQLTDFKWTPVRDVPTYIREYGRTVHPAGVEVTGFPYSSTELQDKFITENVSFESFLSAIADPHSKIYQAGHGVHGTCNYGIVCNGFVRYVFGIRHRVSTSLWYTIPAMREVKPRGEYTVEDIRLCDVLYAFGEGRNHVSLITDILHREDGSIAEIEVSEAVRPTCKRESYTPEEFYKEYKLFALCRYDKLCDVPPLDEQTDRLLWEYVASNTAPKIMVDNGNRSNYLLGEETLISVFTSGTDTVELLCNGELIKSYLVDTRAQIACKLGRGYYVARLKNDGASVEFCICGASINHRVEDGNITVCADPCDSKSRILYADFRKDGAEVAPLSKYEELSDDEKESGRFSRAIPCDAKHFKVYFENDYGVWAHHMTRI